eukprot:s6187_g6.t1
MHFFQENLQLHLPALQQPLPWRFLLGYRCSVTSFQLLLKSAAGACQPDINGADAERSPRGRWKKSEVVCLLPTLASGFAGFAGGSAESEGGSRLHGADPSDFGFMRPRARARRRPRPDPEAPKKMGASGLNLILASVSTARSPCPSALVLLESRPAADQALSASLPLRTQKQQSWVWRLRSKLKQLQGLPDRTLRCRCGKLKEAHLWGEARWQCSARPSEAEGIFEVQKEESHTSILTDFKLGACTTRHRHNTLATTPMSSDSVQQGRMRSWSERHLQSPLRGGHLHSRCGGTDPDADGGARPGQNMQILTMNSRAAKQRVLQAHVQLWDSRAASIEQSEALSQVLPFPCFALRDIRCCPANCARMGGKCEEES